MNTRAVAAALTLSALTACGSTELAADPASSALSALRVNNLQISGTAVYDEK